LGEGGMGIVYSAYDKELDRKVAVKLLRRTDGGEDGHRRMQREAQAMARLSHPNVVQVYEVGFYEGQLFVVMEFVEGQTLRTWCRAKSRRWQEVVRVFSEAGRGLAAAHHAGLVHRDFKPENVLIGDDGRVRVLDFGLARAHEVDDAPTGPDAGVFELSEMAESHASASSSAFASRLTRSGTVLGTPAYMSPEQHMRQPADARSDQFSLCVALHEALAGERPFDEDNRAVLVFAKQTGQVREWPRERTKVPKWLRRAIGRGLSPHPVERWPSMAPLLAELGRVRAGTRRRWLWAGLAVVAVASVVGFGVAKSWAAQSELCSGSEAERSRLWSVPRQGRVRVAMTLADSTVAEQAWPAVSEGVQAYTDEWVAVHREACEATNLRREQSRHLYNLQLQCLERRRGQLDALLDVLENSTIKMVADAAGAVVVSGPATRGGQLRSGVERARGRWLLVLHADTWL
ncbi:MAG: protein kinase domain-containing protein, partial [Nannocystaceae bacterium]